MSKNFVWRLHRNFDDQKMDIENLTGKKWDRQYILHDR